MMSSPDHNNKTKPVQTGSTNNMTKIVGNNNDQCNTNNNYIETA